MSKCLVTGGAGFIGSHIVDKLIALGHDVVVVDNLMLGDKNFVNPQANFHKEDIRNLDKMKTLCEGVNVIFHLAADPRLPISIEDPVSTHEINVSGTLNILEAARLSGVKKIVFSSTGAVYEDQGELPIAETHSIRPKSPYGLHKRIGEQYMMLYVDLFGLETVSLRYFNVFGPRKTVNGGYPMVIPIFLQQKKENKKLTVVGDGEQTRDYVYVSDVVEANIIAWQSDVSHGETINIGFGQQTSVNKIAELIGRDVEYIPERKGEMRFVEADNTKAKKLLGWEPTVTIEDGLEILKKEWGL